MTNPTQDPKRPHVWWYPQPERLIINAAKCATPDPRDARLAELTTALQHIRQWANVGAVERADAYEAFDAIYTLATNALAGAEPCATVEAVVI